MELVYIHEYIDVIGHNRARYQHHMTANWVPTALEERGQRCLGVWSVVGSTGEWPQVLNMWELDGWDGLVGNFAHEAVGTGAQDPSLAEWWEVASKFRSGGFDRVVVPEPWTKPIGDLITDGVRGGVYAHELITVPPGTAPQFLAALREVALSAHQELGLELVGAFRATGVNDSEAIVIWAIPDWAAWASYEQAWLGDGPLNAWRSATLDLRADWRRVAMVDSPLNPLRIGRQPEVGDRLPLDQL